jgi:hypothetical protein
MTLDAVSSPNMLRDAKLRGDYYHAFLNGVPTVNEYGVLRSALKRLRSTSVTRSAPLDDHKIHR